MSLVPSASRSESPEGDPRALASFHDDRPEIQRLFELALEGALPRARPLKEWEPQRLNERHIAMVNMRAAGLKQRQIAQAFGATDSNVSIILNHPDAEYLLSRLQSMRATQPSDIEQRMAALVEPAVSALEEAFSADAESARTGMKRAPLAFKVLDFNGYGSANKPKHVEHDHRHRVSLDGASPPQLGELARAMRESRMIPENQVAVIEDMGEAQERLGAGGESPAAPPKRLSGPSPDTGVPSPCDPQPGAELRSGLCPEEYEECE